MTSYTSPDGIPLPDGTDDITPLDEWLEDQAIATQAALLRPGAVASSAARDAAIPAPMPGQRVWRTDLSREEMYLTAASGAVASGWYPTAGIIPAATLFRGASYSYTTGAGWGVPWDSVKSNVGNCLTPNAANTAHTMNQAGRYRVTIQALQGGTATYYNIRLLLNGTAYATGPSTGTGATSAVALTVDVVVTAGTSLSVLFHSGVNVTNVPAVNDGGQATFMNVQYLGPA